MTGKWAATNTLRTSGFCESMFEADGGIAEEKQCWERRLARKNWCYTCSERGAALALVEAALDAAADLESRVVDGPDHNIGEIFNAAGRLAAALRAVREGQ